MAQKLAKKKPIEGVNTNVSNKLLKDTQARYMLNFERSANVKGMNEGMLTPVPANRYMQVLGLPVDSRSTGAFESKRTKEVYVWVYSASGHHTIYRVNPDLSSQIVYQTQYLQLSPDPIHSIRGAWLFYVNGNKYLVWVDGKNWQGFLDVETSIATNSFNHPYFSTPDPTQYIQLVPRRPFGCITGTWIYPDADDEVELSKQNFLLDTTWQFRIKYIYTDGRESEWSNISTSYWVERTEDQKSARGLPRCLQLRFSAGHPQVEKIVLAFRNCNGNAYAETNPTDWFQYEVIEKWEDCNEDYTEFWTRSIRPDGPGITYDPTKNEFIYIFCGDKECTPIAIAETNRTQNPCPITSAALAVIENRLVLLNNLVGYDPINCNEVPKFEFYLTEDDPEDAQACTPEVVEVKFAVVIHNLHLSVNQLVFTYGQNRDNEGKFFGGIAQRQKAGIVGFTPFEDPGPYGQYFYGKQAGFEAYVEGTDYTCITEQHKASGGGWQWWGAQSDFGSKDRRKKISQNLEDRHWWAQIGTLKVTKGTKGYIRLKGHRSAPGEDRSTSTTVVGVISKNQYNGRVGINGSNTDHYTKELYFDTTNGAVDLTQDKLLVVADLTAPYSDVYKGVAASALCGYVRDKNERPVENADVEHFGRSAKGSYDSWCTDHNGFYFASWTKNDWIGGGEKGVRIFVEGPNCSKVEGAEYHYSSASDKVREVDMVADKVPDYEEKYMATVRIKVVDHRGVALPGIYAVVKGSKARASNNSGVISLPVRNRAWIVGNGFFERLIIMQAATPYQVIVPNGPPCNFTMPDYEITFPGCFVDNTTDLPPIINTNVTVTLKSAFASDRGLKTGGRYGFAPVFHDAAGRHTFIPQEASYLTLPTIQGKGFFAYSRVNWRINGTVNLPDWVKYVSFYRTGNLAFNYYQQWIADKVEFKTAAGDDATPETADKIYITIQSLIDFNNAKSTNSQYDFVPGDRMQIIADAAGDIFPASDGILDFLIEKDLTSKIEGEDGAEDYEAYQLVIENDERLSGLEAGALIQITRQNQCDTEQLFFELCDVIEVHNGSLSKVGGLIDTFDTYKIVTKVKFNDAVQTLPFGFEHHSPSYYFGDHCDDRGRVNVKNPWEKQMHYGRSAYVSDAFLENGNKLGISTFREETVKYFKGEQRGDITHAYSIGRAIRIICEQGSFLAAIGDDFVRMGRDGIARVAPADAFMQEANQGDSRFGLSYEDPQAVYFGGNFAMWLDRQNGAVVLDDFNSPKDVTADTKSVYLMRKIQWMERYNKNLTGFDRMRCVMGYDPVAEVVYLTFHKDTFAHSNKDYDVTASETFGIAVLDGAVFPYSFTPELYATLYGSDRGNIFLAFRNAEPWAHKEVDIANGFNRFFGTAVDQVLKLVVNNDPDKVKLFVSMQQQSLMKYYAPKIQSVMTDSNTGMTIEMESEIPPITMALREAKWHAAFLFNKNTPGVDIPLYNGEAMRGYYAEVTLVRDNLQDNRLGVFDDNKRTAYNELDSIIFSYTLSEQSAYNKQ
jgi:hypothetical protein